MSIYKKNILVGLTAMLGLVLLGTMIVLFGEAPAKWFTQEQINLTFKAERGDGLGNGSPILYKGVKVGQVTDVRLAPDNEGVRIVTLINVQPPLPANVEGVITSQLIGGSSFITLRMTPPEAAPHGQLADNSTIEARFRGVDILPREFSELADELRLLSKQLRASGLVEHVDNAVLTAGRQIEKVGQAADAIQEVVGEIRSVVADPKMRKDLSESMENFRAATASARQAAEGLNRLTETADTQVRTVGRAATTMISKTEARIDDLSKQMGDRLVQVARLMENLESASKKLSDGKGTAAMLLNDPRLYENLVDTSKSLDMTIKDLNRLIQQWEQEGLYLKLKK